MSDWEEQVSQILGDPEQMGRIAELAKSLMGGEGEAAPETPSAGLGSILQSVMGGGKDETGALLEAMKPWLSEKRRGKLTRAVRIARMAKLAEAALDREEAGDDV